MNMNNNYRKYCSVIINKIWKKKLNKTIHSQLYMYTYMLWYLIIYLVTWVFNVYHLRQMTKSRLFIHSVAYLIASNIMSFISLVYLLRGHSWQAVHGLFLSSITVGTIAVFLVIHCRLLYLLFLMGNLFSFTHCLLGRFIPGCGVLDHISNYT